MVILPLHVTVISYLFIVSFLFSVGLRIPLSETVFKKSDLSWMLRALLANVVLVPLAGLFFRSILPMAPDISLGFMLVAVTPGGLFGLHFAHFARGDLGFALTLSLVLALAAVLLVPLSVYIFFPATVSSQILDLRIIVELILFALLPLLLGQELRRRWKPLAGKLEKAFYILVPLLFATHQMLAMRLKSLSIASIGHEALVALILLVAASWIFGWVLGGPGIPRRKVLAIDTAMRNVAICWLIVHKSFADSNVHYAILAFNGVSISMNFLFGLATRFLPSEPPASR